MIAQWMLYVIVVGVALSAAAYLAERALRLWKREARFLWLGSMALSVVVPLVAFAQAKGVLPLFGTGAALPDVIGSQVGMLLAPVQIGGPVSRADIAFALAWALLSTALGLRFATLARRVRLQREAWESATVDGQHILVSRNAGPAVVGFRSPAVVVPAWVLGLDATLRALVLRHEREHLERGDPRLLLAGVVAIVLVPWNPTLWFQFARLRSAMELDCDARVLRAHPDSRAYGSLLLAVAQRADRGGLLAPGFLESKSLLARRIVAMRRATPRHRVLVSAALALATAGLAVVACDVRWPNEPSRPGDKPVLVSGAEPYFEFQVEVPAAAAANSTVPRYPDALRLAGVEGEVLAQFVVNPDGTVDVGTFKVLKSSHELFTQSVKAALPMMRYKPALVGEKPVRQLVQSPFTYSISR